jgi:hypothetical protein
VPLALVEEPAPEGLLAEDPLTDVSDPGLVPLAKKELMLAISSLNGLLLDVLPLELNELPLELNVLPLELNELPLELNELPLELSELPLELNELPLELNELPLELDKLLPLDELLPKRSLKKALTGLLLEELVPENELLLPEIELLPDVEELGTAIENSNTRETPATSNEFFTQRFLAGSRLVAVSDGGASEGKGHSV